MNTDLKALAEYILEQERAMARPMTIEVNGAHFIWNESVKRYDIVAPYKDDSDSEYLVQAALLSVDDIIDWAHSTGVGDGEVLVSRTSDMVARTPRRTARHQRRDGMTKPFFSEYMPQKPVMTFVEFRDWFDSLPVVGKRDDLEAAFGSVAVMDGNEVKVSMTGAVVRFESTSKAGVLGAIPRKIVANIPFGDPSHKIDVEFMITVGKNMAWSVKHYAADGAYDAYLQWAKDKLTDALPAGWIVLCTP